MNLVDALTTVSFPTTTPQLFVVFGFVSQIAGLILQPAILIEDEESAKIAEFAIKDMAFTPDAPVARAIVGFQGIQWPSAGRYIVKFVANGEKVLASFPLTLLQVQLPGPQGSPQSRV